MLVYLVSIFRSLMCREEAKCVFYLGKCFTCEHFTIICFLWQNNSFEWILFFRLVNFLRQKYSQVECLHKLYLNFALNSATDNLPLGQSLLNPSYQSWISASVKFVLARRSFITSGAILLWFLPMAVSTSIWILLNTSYSLKTQFYLRSTSLF